MGPKPEEHSPLVQFVEQQTGLDVPLWMDPFAPSARQSAISHLHEAPTAVATALLSCFRSDTISALQRCPSLVQELQERAKEDLRVFKIDERSDGALTRFERLDHDLQSRERNEFWAQQAQESGRLRKLAAAALAPLEHLAARPELQEAPLEPVAAILEQHRTERDAAAYGKGPAEVRTAFLAAIPLLDPGALDLFAERPDLLRALDELRELNKRLEQDKNAALRQLPFLHEDLIFSDSTVREGLADFVQELGGVIETCRLLIRKTEALQATWAGGCDSSDLISCLSGLTVKLKEQWAGQLEEIEPLLTQKSGLLAISDPKLQTRPQE